MKKIFILALFSGFILLSCTVKTNNGSANLSVTEELKSFIQKQKNGASKTFTYSGTIKNDDWKKIGELISKTELEICLDFSKSVCCDKEVKSYIPSRCFYEKNNLVEIRLPEGLTEIQNYNFYKCKKLRSVYFPKNTEIEFIGNHVLAELEDFEDVHLYNYSGVFEEHFLYDIKKLRSMEMPAYPVRMGRKRKEFKEGDFTLLETVHMGKKKVSFDEWYELCESVNTKDVYIVKASASSSAAGKYSEQNIFDNSCNSWVEGKHDEGIGEFIDIKLSEPTSIKCLTIKNGFGYIDDYYLNNRVKKLEITLDDLPGTTKNYDVIDTPYFQDIEINDFKKAYSKIRIVIKDVYKGYGSDNHTSISEIKVNGRRDFFQVDTDSIRLEKQLKSLGKDYVYYIFPMKDGRHIASVSHYENYSVTEFAGFYIYDSEKWKCIYGENLAFEKIDTPLSVKPVIDLLEEFNARNIPFRIESRYNILSVYPHILNGYGTYHFDFTHTGENFSSIEINPFSIICFGTPEELQQYGNWKKDIPLYGKFYKHTDNSYNYNFLVYAAVFNKNPFMIRYLIDEGYSPNDCFNSDDLVTPYEISIKYNNEIARDTLRGFGGAYRKDHLIGALLSGDLIKFNELVQLYDDVSFVLAYCNNALYRWREFGSSEPPIPHMEKFLNILKSRNVDFSQVVGDEKGIETSLLNQALRYGPKFLNLVLLYDWKIKGDEVADYIYDSQFHDDRKEFMSTLELLDGKSPFKDLSEEQKINITFKIAYDAYSLDEIKFFADRNALSFNAKDTRISGKINIIESLMYDLRKDNDHDEVIKFFIECGADVNQLSEKNGKTRSLMGTMLRSIYYNSVYCEKHYKLFEYLYEKGCRPSYEELIYYVVDDGLDSPYDFTDKDFEMRFKYIYKTLFRDYSGKAIAEGKTLAQLIIEKLGKNYMDDSILERLEEKLIWMISELKAAGCADDWKKEYFEKAGFSKEFSGRVGV